MTRALGRVSLAALWVSLSLFLHAGAAEFTIGKVKRADDKVTVEVREGKVVFTVTSVMGIGGFEAALKAGEWPAEVSVILNRKRIENIDVRTDRLVASGAMLSPQDFDCPFEFLGGGGKRAGVNHEQRAGSLRIRVRETKDGVEMVFPSGMFSDSKQFRVDWVDAYRG